MANPVVDITVDISSDSKTVTIADDTQSWGDNSIEKVNITAVSIVITDNDDEAVVTITDNIVTGGSQTYTVEDDFPLLSSETLPDGVYKYTISYTHNYSGGGTLTKDDGIFYSTRIIEYNINDDLLTYLVGVQAYNYRMNFPKLEEIRRRDNILFAIESAEFLSEIENVETLIAFLQRIE